MNIKKVFLSNRYLNKIQTQNNKSITPFSHKQARPNKQTNAEASDAQVKKEPTAIADQSQEAIANQTQEAIVDQSSEAVIKKSQDWLKKLSSPNWGMIYDRYSKKYQESHRFLHDHENNS